MRIHLCVVGRLRKGPERELLDDYIDRFTKIGRSMGLGPVSITEVEDKRGGGMTAEAELLERIIPKGSMIMTLDERGVVQTSPEFSKSLAKWRDQGQQDLAIIVGGADGIAPSLRARADFSLSLGKMVWPHMLVRVLIAEQLYRAASILAGSPYHRT